MRTAHLLTVHLVPPPDVSTGGILKWTRQMLLAGGAGSGGPISAVWDSGPVHWGPMHHGKWSRGTSTSPRGQTDIMKTLSFGNSIGER